MPRTHLFSSARHREQARGQSLAEFAIILPVFLLLLGAALDLGRLFYAHVAMENAAKEGAVFGASNPRCDDVKEGCIVPGTVRWHVEQELSGVENATHTAACVHVGGSADAGDNDVCEPGDSYRVRVTSDFRLVTPILMPLLGNHVDLESVATSRVVNEAFDPDATPIIIPTPTPSPSPTPAPTATARASSTPAPGSTPTATPTATLDATPSPTPASPTPTATSMFSCIVPNFVGTRAYRASERWEDAGFTGTITVRDGNGNYYIGSQTLAAGSVQSCASAIEVAP